MLERLFFCFFIATSLVACSSDDIKPSEHPVPRKKRKFHGYGKLFGDNYFKFHPLNDKDKTAQNTKKTDESYNVANKKPQTANISSEDLRKRLYAASLDELSSVPLASSDSNAGVIVTDWVTENNKSYKVTIRVIKNKLIVKAFRKDDELIADDVIKANKIKTAILKRINS